MDRWMDRRTKGQTDPLREMRERIFKERKKPHKDEHCISDSFLSVFLAGPGFSREVWQEKKLSPKPQSLVSIDAEYQGLSIDTS